MQVSDPDTNDKVSQAELIAATEQYAPVLRFIADWEAGRFTMTMDEYTMLPELFIKARELTTERRLEEQKKK